MDGSFMARGGGWVMGQSELLLAVGGLGVVFPRSWGFAASVAIGIVLCAMGAAFGIAGVWVLGRSRTAFPKPREDAALVRHGIYARVRHPLYTSVMLLSLGWGLIWESGPAGAAALLLIGFLHAKARREEVWLREKFTEYAVYQRQTRRFVPWLY
jgi:protein-S-isoprenylcysteine O-methyltransferase Ste14